MKINTDQGTITLNNDLYVLALHKNLLSISQFTKENDCNFEFSSTGFVIGHRGTRRMVATRSRHGSLYDLEQINLAALFSTRQKKATENMTLSTRALWFPDSTNLTAKEFDFCKF